MTGNNGMNNRTHTHKRGLIVQPRDLDLLRELALMRVADAGQLMRASGFHSKTRINARLLALHRAGLLRRFFLGSGGGRKALYAISPKGAQMIQVPCRGPRRRGDTTLVADFFVQHQLAVNTVYCDLKFGAIPVEGVRFVHWLAFHEPVAAGGGRGGASKNCARRNSKRGAPCSRPPTISARSMRSRKQPAANGRPSSPSSTNAAE